MLNKVNSSTNKIVDENDGSISSSSIDKNKKKRKHQHDDDDDIILRNKFKRIYNNEKNKYFYSLWNIWYTLLIVALNSYLIYKRLIDIINLLKYPTAKTHLDAALSTTTVGDSSLSSSTTSITTVVTLSNLLVASSSSSSSFKSSNDSLITTSLLNNTLFLEYLVRCVLLGLTILFLLLFIITQFKKIGNYSNDGYLFGSNYIIENFNFKLYLYKQQIKHEKREKRRLEQQYKPEYMIKSDFYNQNKLSSYEYDNKNKQNYDDDNDTFEDEIKLNNNKCSNIFRKLINLIWRHFLPINSLCHLINSLTIILPNILYDKVICNTIQQSQSQSQDIITNNLNLNQSLFNDQQLNNITNNKILQSTINDPNLLKLSCRLNTDSFDINLYSFLANNLFELINYLLAIICLYIRYSLVFWLINKLLAFILSLLGLLTCIEQLFQLYSLYYLNTYLTLLNIHQISLTESSPRFIDDSQNGSSLLLKTKFSINFLYFLLTILTYFSLTPIYIYIYSKYKEKLKLLSNNGCQSRNQSHNNISFISTPNMSNTTDSTITTPTPTTTTTKYDGKKFNDDKSTHTTHSCFNSYFIHLCAAIKLILLCSCKVPFCYDYIVVHAKYADLGIVLCFIIEILHIIILLFIWLLLTLKINWYINLQVQYRLCQLLLSSSPLSSSSNSSPLTIKSTSSPSSPSINVKSQAYDNKYFFLNEIFHFNNNYNNAGCNKFNHEQQKHDLKQKKRKSITKQDIIHTTTLKQLNNNSSSTSSSSSSAAKVKTTTTITTTKSTTTSTTTTAANILPSVINIIDGNKANVLDVTSSSATSVTASPVINSISYKQQQQQQQVSSSTPKYLTKKQLKNKKKTRENQSEVVPKLGDDPVTTPVIARHSDYLDNSETMYRNEIRKSARNVLNYQNNMLKKTSELYHQYQLQNNQPIEQQQQQQQQHDDYFNRKTMIANGIYLSTSSASSLAPSSNNIDNKNQTLVVGSIKYRPYTRRPVVELERRTTSTTLPIKTTTTTSDVLNKIKINNNNDVVEYESRV